MTCYDGPILTHYDLQFEKKLGYVVFERNNNIVNFKQYSCF